MKKNVSQPVIAVSFEDASGSLSKTQLSGFELKASLLAAFLLLLVSLALILSFEFFTSDSIERLESPSHVSSTHWSAPWSL